MLECSCSSKLQKWFVMAPRIYWLGVWNPHPGNASVRKNPTVCAGMPNLTVKMTPCWAAWVSARRKSESMVAPVPSTSQGDFSLACFMLWEHLLLAFRANTPVCMAAINGWNMACMAWGSFIKGTPGQQLAGVCTKTYLSPTMNTWPEVRMPLNFSAAVCKSGGMTPGWAHRQGKHEV